MNINAVRRLLFVILALFCSLTFAQIKYIAVVETLIDESSGAGEKISGAEVREITNEMRREAVNNLPKRYNIMTTETVQSMSGGVLEECADENCVITLGSRIGADYIVRGTISKFVDNLTLTIEIYETEDGMLVAAAPPVRAANLYELLEKSTAACAEMYKKFAGANSTASTQTVQTVMKPIMDGNNTITDTRDGKQYSTVKIGNQTWMAENLNYRIGNSWCNGNDESNCSKYGRLYDWNTAMKACPAEWHLPTNQEWDILVNAVGGKEKAGKKLKSQTGWRVDNKSVGTNDYGFSALPGGYRISGGGFYSVGNYGYWWSATESNASDARFRIMYYASSYVDWNWLSKSNGQSVRCVQDD